MMALFSFCHCFAVSLIFTFNAAFASDPPAASFTSTIHHIGDSGMVIMTCKVPNMSTSPSVEFSKITPEGQLNVMENKPGKYVISGASLIIMAFENDDAGKYRCSVPYYGISKDLTLNYEEPAKIVRFAKYEYSFNKGDEFKLYCNATGTPTPKVWWEKRQDSNFKIEGPLLHIPSVTADDIGTYYCKADNNLGGRHEQGEIRILYVNYAPEMTCVNTTFVSGRGWNVYVTMRCEVRAFPSDRVEWFKKTDTGRKQIIKEDPKFIPYHITKYDDSPQGWYHVAGLHIMVTEPGDAGTYIAVATNKMGTQQNEFTLTVV